MPSAFVIVAPNSASPFVSTPSRSLVIFWTAPLMALKMLLISPRIPCAPPVAVAPAAEADAVPLGNKPRGSRIEERLGVVVVAGVNRMMFCPTFEEFN